MAIQTSSRRGGFQLVELLVSMSSASMLMVGVVTSIYIASRSRDLVTERETRTFLSQNSSERLLVDLSEATAIETHSDSSIDFHIQHRSVMSNPALVRYAWNGPGTPLLFSDVENQWFELSEPLNTFELTIGDTEPQAKVNLFSFDPPHQYVFQSASYGKLATNEWISVPSTYAAGDLLVAALVFESSVSSVVSPNTGWSSPLAVRSNSLELVVHYSFGPSLKTFLLDCDQQIDALCCIAHFRSPSSAGSLLSTASARGSSSHPQAPSASGAENALVLRFLATPQNSVDHEATNLPGHIPVFFRADPDSGALGIAHRTQGTSGTIGSENFSLSSSEPYITATMVFAP